MQERASLTRDGFTRRVSYEEEGRERRVRSSLEMSKALFLFAAGISFFFSIYLWFTGDRDQGLFVGLWVPSILSLGSLLMGGKGRTS